MRHLVLRQAPEDMHAVVALCHALQRTERIALAHEGQGHVQSSILGLLVHHGQSKDATVAIQPPVVDHVQGALGGAPLRSWQEAAQIDAGRNHRHAFVLEFREGLHMVSMGFADHGAHWSRALSAGLSGKAPRATPHQPVEACQQPIVGRRAAVDQQPRYVVEDTGPMEAAQEGPLHEHHVVHAEFWPAFEDGVGDGPASPARARFGVHRHVLDAFDGFSSTARANEGHVVTTLGQSCDEGHLRGGAEVPAKVSDAGPKNPHGGTPFKQARGRGPRGRRGP